MVKCWKYFVLVTLSEQWFWLRISHFSGWITRKCFLITLTDFWKQYLGTRGLLKYGFKFEKTVRRPNKWRSKNNGWNFYVFLCKSFKTLYFNFFFLFLLSYSFRLTTIKRKVEKKHVNIKAGSKRQVNYTFTLVININAARQYLKTTWFSKFLKELPSKNYQGLKVVLIKRSLSHWTPDIFFIFESMRTCALNCKSTFSAVYAKISGKLLIAASQSADSGNRLAVILWRGGISFPLQFEWIRSCMTFSPVSLLSLQITEPVSSWKCGKITSDKCEWAFSYQFFATDTLWIWNTFLLKPLKPLFAI